MVRRFFALFVLFVGYGNSSLWIFIYQRNVYDTRQFVFHLLYTRSTCISSKLVLFVFILEGIWGWEGKKNSLVASFPFVHRLYSGPQKANSFLFFLHFRCCRPGHYGGPQHEAKPGKQIISSSCPLAAVVMLDTSRLQWFKFHLCLLFQNSWTGGISRYFMGYWLRKNLGRGFRKPSQPLSGASTSRWFSSLAWSSSYGWGSLVWVRCSNQINSIYFRFFNF